MTPLMMRQSRSVCKEQPGTTLGPIVLTLSFLRARQCRNNILFFISIYVSLDPSLEVLRPDFLRSVRSYYVGFDNPSSSSSSSPHRDRHHLHGHHRSQRLPLLGDEQSAHVLTPVIYLRIPCRKVLVKE